jgi:hypothetical protein
MNSLTLVVPFIPMTRVRRMRLPAGLARQVESPPLRL